MVASKSYTEQGTVAANPLKKVRFKCFLGENLQNVLPAIAIKNLACETDKFCLVTLRQRMQQGPLV